MKKLIPAHRTIPLAIAVTGCLIGANLAIAQEVTEEIIVRAPIERTQVKTVNGSFAKTEIIELNRFVNISDLDLTKHADVIELDGRIEAMAKESCQKLSDMFPLDRSEPAEMGRCKKHAIASAEKQKKQAIAAAH